MCTIILKGQEPILAEEDIKVYKSCFEKENGVKSIFEEFSYEKDIVYKTDFTFGKKSSDFIASDDNEYLYKKSLNKEEVSSVMKGFHSLMTFDKERLDYYFSKYVFCLFIIPKGSLYYINPVGNVVSNQIIFKEIIK